MHTSRDNYLINTLRIVSTKEETQIYGDTPPKKVRKFKKPASPKLTIVLVSTEAPMGKSKRVKRSARKSTETPARGVVIRETHEMQLTKKKEKVDVSRDDSNNEQVSSNEASDQEKDIDDDKTQSDNEHELDSENETDESESGLEFDHDESEENKEDDEDETKTADKAEGDEDEEMDFTTSQLYDDVDIRLNEQVDTNDGFVQEKDTDAAMSNVKQGNENPKILQVIEDAHQTPTLLTLPDFASVFRFNNKVTALEKEVVELKEDDPLKTQVTALVDEHLDARLGATRDKFMNFLLASITVRITEQVKNQLPQILPKEVSTFSPLVIQIIVTETLKQEVLAKDSSQTQSSYETAATLIEFELKKILIDKMDKSESYLAAPEHRELM
nr:hypothetical protein [Tanacetum cinerariifolium]